MKLPIGAILATFLSISLLAAPKPPQPLQISWQDTNGVPGLTNYIYQTNSAYILMGTTDLSIPITNWPTVAVFTSWTLGPALWMTNTIQAIPDKWFFTMVVTNFWGKGDPSDVAQTGPGSTPPGKLNIR